MVERCRNRCGVEVVRIEAVPGMPRDLSEWMIKAEGVRGDATGRSARLARRAASTCSDPGAISFAPGLGRQPNALFSCPSRVSTRTTPSAVTKLARSLSCALSELDVLFCGRPFLFGVVETMGVFRGRPGPRFAAPLERRATYTSWLDSLMPAALALATTSDAVRDEGRDKMNWVLFCFFGAGFFFDWLGMRFRMAWNGLAARGPNALDGAAVAVDAPRAPRHFNSYTTRSNRNVAAI